MKHTIKYYLNRLPEPERTRALENTTENMKIKVANRGEALISAFSWHDSPQGHDYWSKLVDGYGV